MTARTAVESREHSRRGLVGVGLGLGFLMVLALAIRSLGFEFVFVGDQIVFPPADAQYHLRRAFYTFVNFPSILFFDPYINYPGGAPVPWPPLFDFVLGGVARALAADSRGFEQVAAWAGPVCGALTVIPVYRAGSLLASRGVGFTAGLVYACLPISVVYSRVGNPDHHAAVAMLGAWLLLACLGLAQREASGHRARRWGLLLAAAQTGLLLCWHGSLLYVGLANALLLGVGVLWGRPRALLAQAGAAAASGLLLVPLLLIAPEPLGGRYSAIALSWLHVLACWAVACLAGGLWASQRRVPNGGFRYRLGVAASGGGALLATAMLVPELRAGLEPAFQFLTQADGVGAVTGEQNALFGVSSGVPGANPVRSWGWLVYTIPFAPAAVFGLARTRGTEKTSGASALLLGLWGLFFALLTLGQRRYGNDFAPAFALLFGIGSWRGVAAVSARIPGAGVRTAVRGIGVGVLLVGLLWPVVSAIYGPRALSSLAALEPGYKPGAAVTHSIAATLAGFMAEVRRLTPATSAYLGPGPPPAYGVIAHANLGHAIQYGGRRATATDPFWWYIGPDNWDASFAFLAARTEARALRWAEVLQGRYVITTLEEDSQSVVGQLHEHDGRALGGRPALTRFRLIAESPVGGRGIGEMFRPRATVGAAAYKLFEIVPGARVVVKAPVGQEVEVSLDLRSSQGRPFRYRAVAPADVKGEAVLRLPYATDVPTSRDGSRRTEAVGVYRIQRAGRVEPLKVSEEAVLSGAELRVP